MNKTYRWIDTNEDDGLPPSSVSLAEPMGISSLQCQWDSDSMIDDVADTLLYAEYIADTCGKMLGRPNPKSISKSDWNDYRSFLRAFNQVYNKL